jgi:lantibiotic transport system permease protein
MSQLLHAFSAEVLKLKRTLALRLAFAAPLLIVLLQLGVYLVRGEEMEHGSASPIAGFARGILTLWTLIFLPFYATLATSLLASIDHHEHHWDQLFALPVRRWTVFAAKWIAAVSLVILSSLTIPVFTFCAAELLKLVRHGWAGVPFPAGLLGNGVVRSCAAALLLISLQFWFSLRWRSSVISLSIGIAGIMSGIILITAPLEFLSVYPWTAPGAAASPRQPLFALVWGLSAGLVLGAASCWHLARRDY